MTQAQQTELKHGSFEWWRSDDPMAYERRCADYMALMLFSDQRIARAPYTIMNGAPEFPALWFYEVGNDAPMWVEVKSSVHARDYSRAYPDRLNSAAKALATRA